MSLSRQKVGTGKSRMAQALRDLVLANAQQLAKNLEYATVVSDHEILPDRDGYRISTKDDLVYVLEGVTLQVGDRVVICPLGEEVNGPLLILGKWSKVKTFKQAYFVEQIEFFDPSGESTPIDAMGPSSAAVSSRRQVSRGWYLPVSRARLLVRSEILSGGGAATLTLYDDALGERTSIWSTNEVGDHTIDLASADISDDNFNVLELELSYDDAQNGAAKISHAVLLIGEP